MATVKLYEEIENLKLQLEDRKRHIINLETALYNRSNDDLTVASLKDQIERLSHTNENLLTVNQDLEDKLLHMVEQHQQEKSQMTGEISSLREKLSLTTKELTGVKEEAHSLRKDCNIAVQLLASNPRASQHVHQLLDSLSSHRSAAAIESFTRNTTSSKSSVFVPFATFPPTASCVLVAGKNRRSSSDTEDCLPETSHGPNDQLNKVSDISNDLAPSSFLLSSLNRIALNRQCHNTIHPEECDDRDPYFADALIL